MSEKVVVTGAAGFIGSHLCEALLNDGYQVLGIDSFNPNYDVRIKRINIDEISGNGDFELIESSLNDLDLEKHVADAGAVFHLAAQPGVRDSWSRRFDEYIDANIRATQVLCEACRGKPLKRFVYASSSSVYGDTEQLPMNEAHPTKPHSPYGVTKLSGEALCLLYKRNFGLPAVALRFFTVYGPRQRPDMAFHKFIAGGLDGNPIEIYGNGTQTRDFTFVSDIVDACMRAKDYHGEESVFNIGGGSRIALNDALDILTGALPNEGVEVIFSDPVKGDVMHTYADIALARNELGYEPKMGMEEGIVREIEWVGSMRRKLHSE
ncbi:MAG: NAD-dependent epimerase/dehydratase family protein [Candidatus Latescibacterota bacterium]|nr:MAG: NAD-dependent epimerase/dehydratase family protein [Candidatus Latescibacterota bacterium]